MWAAEAVCGRPGSPAGLQCALCPRGVVRLRPGAERGGYWSTLRKRPFKRGGRAAHVSTSTAAPACGGEVGGCSGGVQRLGNLGGRAGARAGRDCAEFELGKECRCFARVYARALRVGAREHLQLVSQEKGCFPPSVAVLTTQVFWRAFFQKGQWGRVRRRRDMSSDRRHTIP